VFQDHFSNKASIYAEHRPSYPPELIDFLASAAPATNLAWDCGCGSGQMAVPLAERFARVIATDASAEQVAHAMPHPHVEYRHAPAERSGICDDAADLVVAAQAAHWFDLPAFYAEARRVARPAGIIALVTYDLLEVNAMIDRILRDFYASLTWPPERRLVEQRYASIPFPFEEMEAPQFFMRNAWNAEQLIGYVHTWSAVRDSDTSDFEKEVRAVWGDEVRPVRWPIAMRLGRTA
jgi:SAM-dependent methyltransferase